MEFDTNFDYHVEEQKKANSAGARHCQVSWERQDQTLSRSSTMLCVVGTHTTIGQHKLVQKHFAWPTGWSVFLDMVDSQLATFFAHCLEEAPEVSRASGSAVQALKESVRTCMPALQELPVASKKGILQLTRAILLRDAWWVDSSGL